MKKAVLDTNVLISGLFWQGRAHTLLKLLDSQNVELCASAPVLAEYSKVSERIALRYGKASESKQWSFPLVDRFTMVHASAMFKGCRDPKDNMFVDCALASGTTVIVSGDDDLLALRGQVKGVNIITVEEAIDKLK